MNAQFEVWWKKRWNPVNNLSDGMNSAFRELAEEAWDASRRPTQPVWFIEWRNDYGAWLRNSLGHFYGVQREAVDVMNTLQVLHPNREYRIVSDQV